MASEKMITDFVVLENRRLTDNHALLILQPPMEWETRGAKPGQFVQVQIPNNKTFLRRPISICRIDENHNLWLLVRKAGTGTEELMKCKKYDTLNIVHPLGNGFTFDVNCKRPVLIGGGVGVAPLLFLGDKYKAAGIQPTFILGARTKKDILLREEFEKIGEVCACTDDGSSDFKGTVLDNPAIDEYFDMAYCCGPLAMMHAVAYKLKGWFPHLEFSLENMMACGVGACLCCVEPTEHGNKCVCKDGPVFNIKELQWPK